MANVWPLLDRAEDHQTWPDRAACRGLGTQGFFQPECESGRERSAREEAARKVCAPCPVRVECRRHALSSREPYGVWGGLTEEERRALYVRTTA
ncbi:WhiB family transcriptional regulator [Streptomyces sp. NPDC101132]|uniref:WhiB family transcriptional regulator n=1 Tax=Streptomyces sp. NPDC101132 TaxID=3366110 RepID=UPI00381F247F